LSEIYSRYTGGRGALRSEPSKKYSSNVRESFFEEGEKPKNEASASEALSCRQILPKAPPNYGGMIYDSAYSEWTPEGIERIAVGDCNAFSANKNGGKKGFEEKYKNKPHFSHLDPAGVSGCDFAKESDEQVGMKNIIAGIQSRSFSPEDILICAMIILMLNGKSEDDMLLVLVLMMLL
jgi:hypothetical protein